MPVCPIDTGRYGSPEMRRIFEEENRLQTMLNVEAALAEALAEVGEIPVEAASTIRSKASSKIVTVEKVKEREKVTRHDIAAMVEVLSEECGEHGEYVHWGVTSNDITDTALALQLKDALNIIRRRLGILIEKLCEKSEEYAGLVMPGRTHGQHAVPITFGFKLAVHAAELARSYERMLQLSKRVLVGKISGAVGTMAALGPKALMIEEKTMRKLGLEPVEIATQVVCRDRLAELVCWTALLGSSLDRLAVEIRNLQRTEIMEAAEGFGEEQRGSSTMPQKQNPVDSEKVSGLAKVLRGLVVPALENIPLWHERDLSNSSGERFIIPLSMTILDEMLITMQNVLTNLRVYPEHMARNLAITRGRIMSEAVMMKLARKGMGRKRAYDLMRRLSRKASMENRSLLEVLEESPEVAKYMSLEELKETIEPKNYLGKNMELISRAVSYAKSKLEKDAS
ncbi:MAG: adenylosuccinate lyase [Candidatus Brockarchaeota archaeon]|nr:adenylosuccinate lyase [Candidatus Brockarchaeota archaeon]